MHLATEKKITMLAVIKAVLGDIDYKGEVNTGKVRTLDNGERIIGGCEFDRMSTAVRFTDMLIIKGTEMSVHVEVKRGPADLLVRMDNDLFYIMVNSWS